jgi:hypothetical protein
MLKKLLAVMAMSLLLGAYSAKAAILWQNIDSNFQILNNPDTNSADPKSYIVQVKNNSLTNFTNVYLIVPFSWVVDDLPATVAVASTWNNTTSMWDNGTNTIEINNYAYLTQMSDTDISGSWPLSANEPSTLANPASINGTDKVPNVYVGNINAGQTVSFIVNIDFTPGFVPVEFLGYFVQAVPEPSTIGLLAISAIGLLVRRR